MRLINADALLDRLIKAYKENETYSVASGLAMAYDMVQGQPTVEAEPISCKDCVHGSGDIFNTGIVCAKIISATNCDVIDAVVPKDHYCGWGRKEE